MKFIVLGSGSSVPHPKRSSSAYWLETASGTILLDCSASAIHRMAEEGLDWVNLDAIWISHFHLDHCGGLFPFLFGTKYAPETQNRTKPLKIFGAQGLFALLERFGDYELLKQPFPIEIFEIEAFDEFEILNDVKGLALKTPHTDNSFAIRITEKEQKSAVFSSDTGFCKPLESLAKNVDLFVLECSFFKNKPTENHLELAEAMFLIRHARPKRAVLTHFYPEWDQIDFQSEVERFEPPCEIIEARDGLELNL